MPAVSKKQQRFFGIVRAAQKGTLPTGKTTPEVQRAASSMKKKDVKKMASTKHKGLPEKKKKVDEDVDFTYPNVRHNRRFSTGMKLSMNPTTGMGAKKSTKNNPDGDDIRNSTYNSIKRKERKKDAMARKVASKIMSIKKESFNEDAKMAKQSDEKLQAAHKKFSGMEKSPANTFMLKRIQREMNKRKKNVKYSMKEDYVKELEDGLVKMDYPSYDEVDKLMCKIAKENDIDTTTLHMAFKTKHLMVPDDWAKKKMMEPVMIPKTPEMKEELDKNDKPFVKKLVGKLRKGSNTHAKQADDLEKAMNEGVNINEDDGNYFMNKIAKEKGLDLTDPRQRRRANSLARHNAAKGNVNNPAGRKKRKKRKYKLREGSLHKWFKGSKSKDGKGGWVNVVTGGTCASDEPGEGTPKCVSSSKRASMTKAERLSASRRKKKADPNQQSKSGAAKPTYVSTDKKKVKKESYIPEEGYDHIKDRIAMAGGNPGSKKKKDATTIKKDFKDYKRERKGDTNYQKEMRKKYGGRLPSALELVKAKQIEKYGKGAIMDEYINELETKTMLNYIDKASDSASKQLNKAKKFEKKGKLKKAGQARAKMEKRESGIEMAKDKIMKRQEDKTLTSLKRSYEGPDAVREEKKVMGKIKRSFKRDEYGDPIKPDGSYAGKLNIDKNPKDEKITRSEGYVLEDMSGMSQKSGDKRSTESGAGMTAAGVAKYNRRTGGNLKTAVTGKVKRGSKAAKRRKSFCARSKGWTGERGKAARRRWKCNNSVDHMFELEHGEILNERGPQTLGSGARQSSIHAKKGKKSTKKVSGMIKSLKRKGSVLKQSMGPLDASRKALRLKNLKDDVDLKLFSIFINEGHMNKTCGEGEYYCYQSKKCKKIPKGMKIGYGGMLKPEKDDSEESKGKNGKNGNGNGNGNGHGGNGNGNGNGGGDGGGE